MEGDPEEVTEPSTATAREVSQPYVTECYCWSLPLPVPPPLERLDGLILSEQLKHPARERGKHRPRCRPRQASQAETACRLFGCLTLPLWAKPCVTEMSATQSPASDGAEKGVLGLTLSTASSCAFLS